MVEVKLIDFSNILELKEQEVIILGEIFKGKFAKTEVPVSHYDYFPPNMLTQFLRGQWPFYLNQKDS